MGQSRQHRSQAPTTGPAASVTHSAPAVGQGDAVYETQRAAGNSTAQGYMNDLNHGERTLEDGSTVYGAAAREEGGFLSEAIQQIDRRMAQAQLASRFDVVADDFHGPLLPNQVTQAEFERIATMYSDIRRGQTNIQFADTGNEERDQTFQDRAMGDIGDILTTGQGRDLLDSLAYGDVEGESRSITLGNTNNPARAGIDIAPGERAADMFNGTGVDTVINYMAGRDVDMGSVHPNFETADYRQTSSDTVLFHELVHASHYRNGFVNGQVLPDGSPDIFSIMDEQAAIRNDRGVSEEEYQTVGLMEGSDYTENGYRAERAMVTGEQIPQRGNYNGPGPARH